MLKWDGVNANIGSISGVSNDIAVPKGSNVITRGGSGIFPRGINVGTIKNTETIEGEASWHIDITFSQKYAALENVYVVKNLFLDEFKQIKTNRCPRFKYTFLDCCYLFFYNHLSLTSLKSMLLFM